MADQVGGNIVWNLDVIAGKFNEKLAEAKKKAAEAGGDIDKLAKKSVVPLGLDFAAVTGVIYSSIKAATDYQDTAAQLGAVLKSTGGAVGFTKNQLLDMADALQNQSTYSNEAITGAENLLLTFTSIGKDVFPDATKTVLDMSQALGQDLKSSSIQLGKALNDPVQGVTALRRVGVSFNEQQLTQIKTMQESGNLLGAQKLILAELGKEFGGSAYTASQTFAGQMKQLGNNVGDLQRTIGEGLLSALNSLPGGIQGVNKFVIDLNNFLIKHKDILAAVVIALLVVAAVLGGLLLAALIVTAGAAAAWVLGIGAIVVVVAFVATLIAFHFNEIKNAIVTVLSYLGKVIKENFDLFLQLSKNAWGSMVSFFTSIGGAIVNAIVQPFKDAYNGIVEVANKIKKAANEINPFVKHSPSLVENVQAGIGIIKDQYKSLGDIKIPPINHQIGYQDYAPAVIPAGTSSGGAGMSKSQSINITVGSIRDQGDIDSLVRELGYRSNL